jgi:hypothetical protein
VNLGSVITNPKLVKSENNLQEEEERPLGRIEMVDITDDEEIASPTLKQD